MALVGWWPLNGTLEDKSINNLNLCVYNDSNSIVTEPTGVLGSCYSRTTVSPEALTTSDGILLSGSFTMACWAFVTTTDNTANGLVTNHNHMTNSGAGITVKKISDTDVRISCNTGNGTSRTYATYYGTTNIYNKWAHLVLRYDAILKEITLWVDGIKEKTVNNYNMYCVEDKVALFAWSTGYLHSSAYRPICKLNDVRIYNHALSTKEIKELAKCKVLHYTFNQFQEPTTNLLPQPLSFETGYTKESWNGTITDNAVMAPDGTMTATYIKYISGYFYKRNITPPTWTISPGQTFTFSCWVKQLTDLSYSGIDIWCYNISSGVRARSAPSSVQGEWVRQSVTYTAQAGETDFSFTFIGNRPGTSSGCEIAIWHPQVEFKDHPTPFVVGSRTGKVYDCSGYNNNADLTEDTTPKWVEGGPIGSGCYEFKQNQKIEINNILTNAFTISFWMKSVSDKVKHVIGNANGFFANGGGWFIGSASNAADMYFEVQDASSRTPIRFYSNRIYDWSHFIAIYDNGAMKTYLNGELKSSGFKIMGNVTNNIILGDKNISSYFMDGDLITDVRFYSTALSENDIRELYQAGVSVDRGKSIYCNEIKEDKYVKPILDYSTWTVGTSGSQPGFNINGSSTENYIIEGSDPFGNTIPIWEARPDATSGADGGWNSTPAFNIDNTKCYRFSTWVKRTVKGNGHFYLGLHGYNSTGSNIGVLNRSSGSVNTNPYFQINSNWGEWESGLTDKWYLVVGHVFPAGSGTGSNHPESGVYDINGNKVKNAEIDFVWQPDVVKAIHRSYLYYSTDTSTRQQWCYPRVDICDGSEPTIADLLNGIDYEHYKILKGEESSGSIRKTGLIKVNEVNSIGPTNGLVLYMPLNGNTKDYSGNKYDGVNYGATVVQGLGNKLAYEFDGVSLQYIDIPDTPKYEKFTLSAWVYNAPGGDERHSILRNFWEIVGTSLQYWSYDFSETYWRASPSGTVPYDTWTHIVTTWDGSKIRHYANGVLVYTQPEACTGTSQSFLSIGGYSGRDFKGKLQDLRIYNRALSPQEISWLYDMYNPNKNTGAKVFNNNIIYADSFKEGY